MENLAPVAEDVKQKIPSVYKSLKIPDPKKENIICAYWLELDKRIAAVTSQFVLMLTVTKTGVVVKESGHLCLLVYADSPAPERMRLEFHLPGSRDSNMIRLEGQDEPTINAIMSSIKQSLDILFFGTPDKERVKFQFEPKNRKKVLPKPPEEQPFGGFVQAYRAWSTVYGTKLNFDLIKNVMQSKSSKEGQLRLMDVRGLDKTKDFIPIFQSLKGNTHFRSVHIQGTKAQKLLLEMAPLFQFNETIETLQLQGIMTLPDQFSKLGIGQLIKSNIFKKLKNIDFSDNSVAEGAKDLGVGLGVIELESLKLSRCNLVEKNISSICKSLKGNRHCATSLEYLNLSGNKIGAGTKHIGSFLADLKQDGANSLKTLMLSDIQGDLGPIFACIVPKVFHKFSMLDISKNKLDKKILPKLIDFLNEIGSLKQLDVSYCMLTPEAATEIAEAALLSNGSISEFTLILDGNDFSKGSPDWGFFDVLKKQNNSLETLYVESCNMAVGHIQGILKALEEKVGFKSIYFGKNMRVAKKTDVTGLVQEFAGYVARIPHLDTLSLKGGEGYALSTGLVKLFEALEKKNNVRTLDVSQHKFGDEGMSALAKLIKANKNLEEIDCSGSLAGRVGYSALREAIVTGNHKKVRRISKMKQDLDSKANAKNKEELAEIIDDIRGHLKANQKEAEKNAEKSDVLEISEEAHLETDPVPTPVLKCLQILLRKNGINTPKIFIDSPPPDDELNSYLEILNSTPEKLDVDASAAAHLLLRVISSLEPKIVSEEAYGQMISAKFLGIDEVVANRLKQVIDGFDASMRKTMKVCMSYFCNVQSDNAKNEVSLDELVEAVSSFFLSGGMGEQMERDVVKVMISHAQKIFT